jgi:hypothetical protein
LFGIPYVNKDEVKMDEGTIAYDEERRLAQMRNVPEIKQDMYVGKIHYMFDDMAPKAFRRLVIIWLMLLFTSVVASFTPLAWVSLVTTPLLFSLVFSRVWFRARGKSVTVNYIPHLVTSLVAEYERVPDMKAVRKSIRQKVLRLACLPVPDNEWYHLVGGSEQVALTILKKGSYFAESAACFMHGSDAFVDIYDPAL